MTSRCPICCKPTDSETSEDFPFCSERCRLLDRGNWASEKYRISEPIFDESEFEGANQSDSQSGGGDRDENQGDDEARGRNG